MKKKEKRKRMKRGIVSWKKGRILCKKKKGIKIKNRYICSDADSFHGRNRNIRVESEISRTAASPRV